MNFPMDFRKPEFAHTLQAAKPSERSRIVEDCSAITGFSQNTIYRHARKNGFNCGRKKRSDAGRCCLSDVQIRFVCGMVFSPEKGNTTRKMTVKKALELAEINGIIPQGTISLDRMQYLVRKRRA